MKLTIEELYSVKGGASILSYNTINAICRLIDTLLDFGRTIGKTIKSYVNKK